jgi:hypothetical protein
LAKFEKWHKKRCGEEIKSLIASGSSDEQAVMHARPGFVATDGTRPHLHAPNGLFGGIISPGHIGFMLESAVALPGLAQAPQQGAQLLEGSEWLVSC